MGPQISCRWVDPVIVHLLNPGNQRAPKESRTRSWRSIYLSRWARASSFAVMASLNRPVRVLSKGGNKRPPDFVKGLHEEGLSHLSPIAPWHAGEEGVFNSQIWDVVQGLGQVQQTGRLQQVCQVLDAGPWSWQGSLQPVLDLVVVAFPNCCRCGGIPRRTLLDQSGQPAADQARRPHLDILWPQEGQKTTEVVTLRKLQPPPPEVRTPGHC